MRAGMFKTLLIYLIKLGVLVSVIAISVILAHRIGAFEASLAICIGMGIVCAFVAILLRRVPVGKVTLVNYAAPVFLPFGYFIGKGKLVPIVIASWVVWSIIGAVSAIAGARGYDPRVVTNDGQRHVTASLGLLIISWLIEGFAILYLSRTIAKYHAIRSPGARTVFLLIGILAAIIAISAVLLSQGWAGFALLVAGGPIVLAGGAYGLFIAMLLITKPRWN
jgi:hypothetical protein